MRAIKKSPTAPSPNHMNEREPSTTGCAYRSTLRFGEAEASSKAESRNLMSASPRRDANVLYAERTTNLILVSKAGSCQQVL